MKKLKLELDDLRVDTFTPGREDSARGTVDGHYGTTHTENAWTCISCKWCEETVNNFTCEFTGPGAEMTCCQAAC
jgi:hypothetical protein